MRALPEPGVVITEPFDLHRFTILAVRKEDAKAKIALLEEVLECCDRAIDLLRSDPAFGAGDGGEYGEI